MENARKLKEHGFLERLVGEWTVTASHEGESMSSGDHPDWIEKVRSLHGIWFVAEGNGEMPGGGAATTVLTLGYDPAKGKYIGTWIGSMMSHMWVYEGDLDAGGNVLTLNTSGPDFETEGKTANYREVIAFEDDDNRTFTSGVEAPDGTWKTFMTAQYTRRR